MKPYLLIAGYQYYPASGTGDWIACFETYEEAGDTTFDTFGPTGLIGDPQ